MGGIYTYIWIIGGIVSHGIYRKYRTGKRTQNFKIDQTGNKIWQMDPRGTVHVNRESQYLGSSFDTHNMTNICRMSYIIRHNDTYCLMAKYVMTRGI